MFFSLFIKIGYRIYKHYQETRLNETSYLLIMFWMIIILLVGYLVVRLIADSRASRVMSVVLLPGVIVRDLFTALGCLVTGTTITDFNLFRMSGDRIGYEKSKLPVVGDFVVAVAPMVGIVLLVGYVSVGFDKAGFDQAVDWSASPMHNMQLSLEGAEKYIKHVVSVVFATWRDIIEVDFREWTAWLYLLLMANLVLALAPQAKEMKYLLAAVGLYGVGFYLLHVTGMDLLKYDNWHHLQVFLLRQLGVLAALVILLLAIVGACYGVAALWRMWAPGGAPQGGGRKEARSR